MPDDRKGFKVVHTRTEKKEEPIKITVRELMANLQGLPPDMRVVISGPDGAFNDIGTTDVVPLKLGEGKKWYEGSHTRTKTGQDPDEYAYALIERSGDDSEKPRRLWWKGYCYEIGRRKYRSGRTAIVLEDEEGDASISVNLPEIELAEDEHLLRNYSEFEGILNLLTSIGFCEDTGRRVASGFAQIPIVRVLDPYFNHTQEASDAE